MRKTNIDDIARQLHGPETDTVELNELLDHVRRVIDDMPSQQRRVFKMSREDGIANRKIAEQLGISIRTVENHIAAAMRKLREAEIIMELLLLLYLSH